MKILIVEDHLQLAEDIKEFLSKELYECYIATTSTNAKYLLSENTFDIILLDITLPDDSGLFLLEFIKKNKYPGCIIIISAQNSLDFKLRGLDGGADDYITKPFPLPELHSRIKAIKRRNAPEQNQTLVFHEITLDLEAIVCTIHEIVVNLTKKEFNLLVINNKNRVLSKQAIALHLWGDYTFNLDNMDFIYQHLKNLRKKIIDAGGTDYLQTIYGVGYKWTD